MWLVRFSVVLVRFCMFPVFVRLKVENVFRDICTTLYCITRTTADTILLLDARLYRQRLKNAVFYRVDFFMLKIVQPVNVHELLSCGSCLVATHCMGFLWLLPTI